MSGDLVRLFSEVFRRFLLVLELVFLLRLKLFMEVDILFKVMEDNKLVWFLEVRFLRDFWMLEGIFKYFDILEYLLVLFFENFIEEKFVLFSL